MIIYYVYPMHHDVSFKYVALEHIKMLKTKYTVYDIPELNFYQFTPFGKPLTFVHPFFYGMVNWTKIQWAFFKMYRSKVKQLIGVEVADSDRIADNFINIANSWADALVVNSRWSYDAYVKSGLKIPVYMVQHNYDPKLEMPDEKLKVSQEIRKIADKKKEKHIKVVLFFSWHSGYRKGDDLFQKIARKIQKERDDVYFLVKSPMPRSDLADLRLINVTGVVPFDDIVELYRIADITLLLSRGGSFELNGLESLVSGTPTIAPDEGPWVEYFPPALRHLLAKTAAHPIVLPDNPIHIGHGVEVGIDDVTEKALKILDNIEEEKAKVKSQIGFFRENYSFNAIKNKLLGVVSQIVGENTEKNKIALRNMP
ncbi:glycosyltransferase [Acidianus rod-shaped virus 1]|uniref:Putative glycosyl transferase n=1 Tax=Acidianus rod-shaped virus 1 TaxID=309181 RepID=Q50I41_9VIRU|nr:glycosyltransferase [Acidianus rod-shaped virus 1]CAI44185.1 putative glycosyl transferase [Acidianus rod-shaped virus 1]